MAVAAAEQCSPAAIVRKLINEETGRSPAAAVPELAADRVDGRIAT